MRTQRFRYMLWSISAGTGPDAGAVIIKFFEAFPGRVVGPIPFVEILFFSAEPLQELIEDLQRWKTCLEPRCPPVEEKPC